MTPDDARPTRSTHAEMIEILGDDLVARLIVGHGGTRIWVPRRIPPDHWLARALGAEGAARLAEWCGGGPLHVPCGYAQRRAQRDDRIRRDAATVRPAALARRYGLTVGRIYQILRG